MGEYKNEGYQLTLNESLDMYFQVVEDPRQQSKVIYPLIEILKLVLIAVLCGEKTLKDIVIYGKAKIEFIRKEFAINKIPSESTISRVIAILDTEMLEIIIQGILQTIKNKQYQHIAFDGKFITTTQAMENLEKMNIVTAYTETGLSIMQETVSEKTNEIPIVQSMLDYIDVKGKIVTADALHGQVETAKKVIDQKGDYLLQIKGNQKSLYEAIYKRYRELRNKREEEQEKEMEISEIAEEKEHGRVEKRRCYVIKNKEYFSKFSEKWVSLNKVIVVERERTYHGKTSEEISCYISSAEKTADEFLKLTREHWGIESMHHILDITFDEDRCTLYTKTAQENMNIFRKASISVHKIAKPKNESCKGNMHKCLLSDSYLLETLDKYYNNVTI